MSENTDADVNADDTEGHLARFDQVPSANDDDTEGHLARFDQAPSISGALDTDPNTQS